MAKGQMKSNREAKKPKKTDAERLKAKSEMSNVSISAANTRPAPKK